MKIVFMGTTDFSVPILAGLLSHHEVSLVVTQPDRPFGRKQVLKPSPVKEFALSKGLKLFQPEKIKVDYQRVLDESPDVIIVAAYGQMIPKAILEYPKYKCINVHASLLPKYRGGSPMHTAIKNGDSTTGVTIMYMALKMDAGELLLQEEIPVEPHDNVGTIESKLSVIGTKLLLETLSLIQENKIKSYPQDESLVSFAWTIKPEEELLDFTQTAEAVYNHVRAFNPWPVAHLEIDGLKIKVYEVSIAHMQDNQYREIPIGAVADIIKGEVYIKVKNGFIILKTVQPSGRNMMDIKSYMNGAGKSVFYVGKLLK
jgi:methionyl-tRNA formyltransferase